MVLMLVLAPGVFAGGAVGFGAWGLRHWTSANGLPQDTVLAMTQTRDGYLWLGTENGLARFDGIRFTTWNQQNSPGLANNFVQALAEDRAGTLWIGTGGGGLSKWNGRSIQRFADQSGLGGSTIYALHADREGVLWVGTEHGLRAIREGRVVRFGADTGFPDQPVYSVVQTEDGAIWFATFGAGLGCFHKGRLQFYTHRDGLADDRVILLHPDDGNGLMVATYGGVVQRFAQGKFGARWDNPSNNTSRGIWALLKERGGSWWAGSFGAGLGLIEGNQLQFPASEGVVAESVWSLLEDREGNRWAGTSEGLYQLRRLPLRTFSRGDGLPSNVVCLTWESRDGALWVGTSAGLVRWGPSSAPGQERPAQITPHQVLSMAEEADGTLWFGTASHGLLRRGPGASTLQPVAGPWGNSPVHALAVDSELGLLVGTFGKGLHRCHLQSTAVSCRAVPEAGSTSVITLRKSRSGVWLVGTRDGLALLTQGRWRRLTAADGLGSNHVTAIHEDAAGTLWIGTEGGGVVRYSQGKVDRPAHRLPDELVYSIQEDRDGRLWLGTPSGLFRFAKAEFPGRKEQPLQLVSYGLLDGMLATQIFADTPHTGLRHSNGTLWFASMRGLVRVDPKTLRPNEQVPPVAIEEVRIDGVPLSDPWSSITVPAGSRRLEIAYTALSLSVPEKQRFRYRLEGYDEHWVDAGTSRVAAYTNLPPGNYELRVVAANNDGLWNETGATKRVEWRPHFWQAWWFVGAVAVTAGGVALWGYRYHVGQLRARHAVVLAERTRIAREIHDTYLQGFTGIVLQLEGVRHLVPMQDLRLRTRLETILKQADVSLREGRQSVWNLRDTVAKPAALLPQLEAALRPVLEQAELTLLCRTTGVLRSLDPGCASEVVRLFEEAARNVIRHAKATKVELCVAHEPEGCRITLADNGCGFVLDQVPIPGHFGLHGMQERARSIGGTLNILSQPNRGTIVELHLPWRYLPRVQTPSESH